MDKQEKTAISVEWTVEDAEQEGQSYLIERVGHDTTARRFGPMPTENLNDAIRVRNQAVHESLLTFAEKLGIEDPESHIRNHAEYQDEEGNTVTMENFLESFGRD